MLRALCFALISLAYFYAALSVSDRNHLWMDEVLAVLIARAPSISQLLADLWHGSDFSPPTYHLLLHALKMIVGVGNDRLVWRLPSVAAVYGAGLCVYSILRPRLNPLLALLGFALVLDSSLFGFAVQARPYALLALGLAAALLVWSGYEGSRRARLRAAVLWLILALCVALHFYGLIVVAAIGFAELIQVLLRRQIRWGIWLALVLTIPVELALAPLFLHFAQFSAGDILAPEFYGRPNALAFLRALSEVLIGAPDEIFIFLLALGLTLAAWALRRAAPRPAAYIDTPPEFPRPGLPALEIMLLAVFALPFVTFALSLLVTKSFATRYMIAAGIFPALALPYLLDKTPARRVVALVLMALLAGALVARAHVDDSFIKIVAMIRAADPQMPVVVGEGLLYIELMEALDAGSQARIFYLQKPANSASPDPTNENEVKRLAQIHPNYRVSDFESFVAEHKQFYLLSRSPGTMDTTTPALQADGLVAAAVVRSGNASLLLVRRQ